MFMETLALDLPGIFDSRLHGSRRFTITVITQFFIVYSGDFNMDVDPIQQWTRDPFLVSGHS